MSTKRIVVIGSGIAALACASYMPTDCEVIVMTKHTVGNSNSTLAQGGIASSWLPDDSIEQHVGDTLAVGSDHNDAYRVKDIIRTGKEIIIQLLAAECPFDKTITGEPALGREGAHTSKRIFHAGGDQTGRILVKFLSDRLGKHIRICEHTKVLDIIHQADRCAGVRFKTSQGELASLYADAIVLATGGCGHLYSTTSNDKAITGGGLMMAYRAGAALTDLEFTQFHPTLLVKDGEALGLISEAVRGEGAVLEDENGRRIMEGRHPQKDLAARDILSRIIYNEQQQGHRVYLNIHAVPNFVKRFPTISKLCQEAGIEIASGRIPVSPGMHFLMGGVVVDDNGQTNVKGLYAIGEVACTGFHGANRLASNSLLEGLVYGQRAARHIAEQQPIRYTPLKEEKEKQLAVPCITMQQLQQWVSAHLSIVRDHGSLSVLIDELSSIPYRNITLSNISIHDAELANSWALVKLMAQSALLRTESRGGHFRTDYPARDDFQWRGKQIVHCQGYTSIIYNQRIGN
ncbi:L-aspartate oxidase [Xenorhabdus budapestensis]|uniref:L-aspartate oxidase n=1 Tax=Xenorhabdus budapestensis TaxID=290110 RepID=A0A2D0J318_XENBU|nr:L-aspartate oxidase [Xenorhabdus budapestensis]PHM28730.1 succinate dehydrogenase flavoprotein subunit [Xenorhabdus budapestensis]